MRNAGLDRASRGRSAGYKSRETLSDKEFPRRNKGFALSLSQRLLVCLLGCLVALSLVHVEPKTVVAQRVIVFRSNPS